MTRAYAAQIAGDPLPFDPDVKTWPFWIAGRDTTAQPPQRRMTIDPVLKDTTHISIIDKDGNIFDSTPTRRLDHGRRHRRQHGRRRCRRAVSSSGSTRLARRSSVRARGRATRSRQASCSATASRISRSARLAATTRSRRSCRRSSTSSSSTDKWYPNLHTAFELPRMQTLSLPRLVLAAPHRR